MLVLPFLILSILFLSLAGIPPFIGFFSKFFIFSGIIFMNFFFIEYFPILIILVISGVLSTVIFSLSFVIAVQNSDPEKLSAYECGFDPYEDARNVFDVRFYLVAILFIIFDLEAVFFFPWSISLSFLSPEGFWSMVDFLIELLFGFIYAWEVGGLNWE